MKTLAGVPRRKAIVWFCVAGGLLLLAAANGHLVYVAALSQPDCVPHARQVQVVGEYRAAISSCSVK
jgi:hypothetical protein